MTTGEPTLDSILTWVTSGGTLSSPGATLALATIVSAVIIPTLTKLASKFNWSVSGIKKTYVVYGASLFVVMVVGVCTHAVKNLNDAVPMAVTVSMAAMGLHANKKAASDAKGSND